MKIRFFYDNFVDARADADFMQRNFTDVVNRIFIRFRPRCSCEGK